MLIDKVSPVCEIVFNFIQFPSATRAMYVLPSCPYSPPFGTGERKEKITWYCFLGNSVQGFPSYFRKLRHEKGCRSLTQTHKLGWIIQSGFSKKKFEIHLVCFKFCAKSSLICRFFWFMIWLQKFETFVGIFLKITWSLRNVTINQKCFQIVPKIDQILAKSIKKVSVLFQKWHNKP